MEAAVQWMTVEEIHTLYRRPVGTIYRLASVHQWRKADDRRPALYLADDVEAAFSQAGPPRGVLG